MNNEYNAHPPRTPLQLSNVQDGILLDHSHLVLYTDTPRPSLVPRVLSPPSGHKCFTSWVTDCFISELRTASMSPTPTERPRIAVAMAISPQTYHFSCPRPPTLSFTLTSHASQCLTILISRNSPLNTKWAMNLGNYPILDLSTSPPTPIEIGDMTGYISAPPSPNELLVLQPGQESKRFEVAFNRGGTYEPSFRPQPWSIVRKGRVLDEDDRETSVRRPSVVHGVDGLEPGKSYKTTMSLEKLQIATWWWGDERCQPAQEELGDHVGGIEWEVINGGVEFRVEE